MIDRVGLRRLTGTGVLRVEVEYCSLTRDECKVLEKIQEASVAEAEWQAGPDAWRMDVDPDEDSDTASDSEDSMMEWEEEEYSAADTDDEDEWCGVDEDTVAQGLYWLRVRKEYPVQVLTPNAAYIKRGKCGCDCCGEQILTETAVLLFRFASSIWASIWASRGSMFGRAWNYGGETTRCVILTDEHV